MARKHHDRVRADANSQSSNECIEKESRSYVRKHGIMKIALWSVCFAITGKHPIPFKWVDTSKGDDNNNPNYRSRLVVREIKGSQQARGPTSGAGPFQQHATPGFIHFYA